MRKSFLQPEQWVSIMNMWACPWTTYLHRHERVKKPSAKEARSGKWGWGSTTYLSALFWQQIKELGKSVSYIFWPCDTITLWSSSLKCHVALWLHSGGDAVLLTHTHVDSRQPRGEPGMMPRSAHVYLFMGKKKFPKFCLCNLSFNHQALCRNKSLILRKHLSQVYFLKVEKSTHQWLGF